MKKYNKLITSLLFCLTVVSCKNSEFTKENISIIDKKTHFKITIDYTDYTDYEQTGVVLGEAILKMIPDYEKLIDSYINEMTKGLYTAYLFQMERLVENLHPNYLKEMQGIASNFSSKENIQDDGKLSLDEFLLFNFFADIIPRTMGCSFIGSNKEASNTGDAILSRNLEWYDGSNNQLAQIQTVMEFNRKGISTVSIGYAGIMGIITGVNDQKIFTGILDSPYKALPSKGKKSYMFQVRYALENSKSITEMIDYINNDREYMRSYLLAISDNKQSIVLENYQRSLDSGGLYSKVRKWDTELNHANWEIKNSIAAVNSFLLPDLPDNHYYKHNKDRLDTINTKLKNIDGMVNLNDLKYIATTKSISPAKYFKIGDIYNSLTQQIVLYRPETFEAQVFFYPKDNDYIPDNPVFEQLVFFK